MNFIVPNAFADKDRHELAELLHQWQIGRPADNLQYGKLVKHAEQLWKENVVLETKWAKRECEIHELKKKLKDAPKWWLVYCMAIVIAFSGFVDWVTS